MFLSTEIWIYSYLQTYLLFYVHPATPNSSICVGVGSSLEGGSCKGNGVPLVTCIQWILINMHVHIIWFQLEADVDVCHLPRPLLTCVRTNSDVGGGGIGATTPSCLGSSGRRVLFRGIPTPLVTLRFRIRACNSEI